MASQLQLLNAFDTLLEPQRFRDYGPNGLQVEGKQEVRVNFEMRELIVAGIVITLLWQ